MDAYNLKRLKKIDKEIDNVTVKINKYRLRRDTDNYLCDTFHWFLHSETRYHTYDRKLSWVLDQKRELEKERNRVIALIQKSNTTNIV